MASTDPIAIDQASYALVNNQLGFSDSLLSSNREAGVDKFHGLRSPTVLSNSDTAKKSAGQSRLRINRFVEKA